MKPRKRLSERSWYPNAVAISIGVVLFAALTHLPAIRSFMKTVGAFFIPVILGCVIAYLVNPLAMLLQRTVFKKIRKESARWTLSVFAGMAIVLAALVLLLLTLIPQLIDSVTKLVNNLDRYVASLRVFIESSGLEGTIGGLPAETLVSSSEELIDNIATFAASHLRDFLSASAGLGKSIVNWVIAAILSIYLLTAKDSLKKGVKRLLYALFSDEHCERLLQFLGRCNNILIRYIIYTLIDAIIIGGINAVFMALCGMQYVGLVSVVVGVTNLIPTFGPVIGAVIGGFILVLVKPMHALMFIVFTLILQTCDGYIIKPKLFGDSLGVSGLLILVSIVVCGNMFGILGILLAIPLAAIADFVYSEELIPALERRKAARKAAEGAERKEELK